MVHGYMPELSDLRNPNWLLRLKNKLIKKVGKKCENVANNFFPLRCSEKDMFTKINPVLAQKCVLTNLVF